MTDPAQLTLTHAAAFAPERGWTESEFADLLADPAVILTGDARSFVLGRIVMDEAEVLTLATHPDHRRSGLARGALTLLQDEVRTRGGLSLFLEVAEDNAAARGLYDRFGFVQVGRRNAYYSRPGTDPVAALILRRSL